MENMPRLSHATWGPEKMAFPGNPVPFNHMAPSRPHTEKALAVACCLLVFCGIGVNFQAPWPRQHALFSMRGNINEGCVSADRFSASFAASCVQAEKCVCMCTVRSTQPAISIDMLAQLSNLRYLPTLPQLEHASSLDRIHTSSWGRNRHWTHSAWHPAG